MKSSSALQKDPLQALFNYVLEVVLVSVVAASEVWRSSLERGEGNGKESDWSQGLGVTPPSEV